MLKTRKLRGIAAGVAMVLLLALQMTAFAGGNEAAVEPRHSVELIVAENGTVTEARINGEKGLRILGDAKWEDKDVETVLDELISAMLKSGDADDLSGAILLTAQNGGEQSLLLQQRYEQLVTQALSVQDMPVAQQDAVEKALSHAAVAQQDAERLWARLDREDGRLVWEVEFVSGGYEFDYEIDADTGALVQHEKELDDDAARGAVPTGQKNAGSSDTAGQKNIDAAGQGSSYIGETAAQKTAIAHAGVSSSDVRGYKCELDREDGRMVYEIEFEAGGYEYEYEIDAATGAVLKSEKDRD